MTLWILALGFLPEGWLLSEALAYCLRKQVLLRVDPCRLHRGRKQKGHRAQHPEFSVPLALLWIPLSSQRCACTPTQQTSLLLPLDPQWCLLA